MVRWLNGDATEPVKINQVGASKSSGLIALDMLSALPCNIIFVHPFDEFGI